MSSQEPPKKKSKRRTINKSVSTRAHAQSLTMHRRKTHVNVPTRMLLYIYIGIIALIFFRLLPSNCLNWKIYCDDHFSLSSTTAVQYEFHMYFTYIGIATNYLSSLVDQRVLSRLVYGPTLLYLPAWREVSKTWLQKRSPGRNLGEHRSGWGSGTKSRGTAVSYTHLRAHETSLHLVCRLLLEKTLPNKFATVVNIDGCLPGCLLYTSDAADE